MRKLAWSVVAFVGLVLAVGLVLHGGSRSETPSGARPSDASVSRPMRRPAPALRPPPSGALRIRGVVKAGSGPAAGVRVSASRPEPGQTLSELPCPPEVLAGGRASRSPAPRLPQCLEQAAAQVAELVEAREGEAPVYAEAVTAEDGTFVLDGLPEGRFALWALGEQGATVRSGVAAGTDGVELLLETGVTLEGSVLGEGAPLAGARVTALASRHTRFFDALTGTDGRFHLGPLPKEDFALVVTADGWLPGVFPSHRLSLLAGRFELFRPRTVTGRVLSPDGEPAPGVDVHAALLTAPPAPPEQVATSDAEGRFAFTSLPSGTWRFSATRNEHSVLVRVVLGEGPPPEVVLTLGQGLLAVGTVLDEAGHPIAGATVAMYAVRNGWVRFRAVTGPDGRYQLGPVEPGSYALHASAPRYVRQRDRQVELTRGAGTVDFMLAPSAVVEGTVVDSAGQPVAGVALRLEPSPSRLGTMETTETDEDGRFLLNAPTPGDYQLTVASQTLLTEVLPVRAPAALRVVLRPGASVSGTVTDARGLPLDRVWLTLRSSDAGGQDTQSGGTDEQGRFRLGGVKAGAWVLEATLPSDSVLRTVSRALTLKDGEQAEVSLRLEDGRTLSGVVVDGAGKPVAGVLVHARLPEDALPSWGRGFVGVPGPNDGVRSGPDGRFTLRHLVAEAYEVMARKEDYTFAPERSRGGTSDGVTLRVGAGTAEVRLVLERRGHVRGRVLGPDGTPLTAFSVNGQPVSDPGGAFDVPFQESGDVPLTLAAEDLAPVLRRVPVRAGIDVDLGDVRMDAGRQVRGRVVDAETLAPVAWARVRAIAPDEGSSGGSSGAAEPSGTTARTDLEGNFVLPNVEARPLTLVVGDNYHLERRMAVDAATAEVVVTLHRGARVEVTVRDRRGQPLEAMVRFTRDEGGTRIAETSHGVTVERGLSPGDYTVSLVPLVTELPGPIFLAQRLRVPDTGEVALAFTEQTGGATLEVRVGAAPGSDMVLLPGAVPVPARLSDLERLLSAGLRPEWRRDAVVFRQVPAGRATLLLLRRDAPPRYHREELDVPAEGTVTRDVRPVWRKLEAGNN